MPTHASLPLFALAALLGAAAPGLAPARAQQPPCPPPGQVVVLSDGRSLVQQGADPAEPMLCRRLVRRPGEPERAELLWGNAFQEGQPENRAARRAAFLALLPWQPGKEVAFRQLSPDGGALQGRLRVLAIGRQAVPLGSFEVVTLAETLSGPGPQDPVFTAVTTLEATTGTHLHWQAEIQHPAGRSHARPAAAERVTPPLSPAAGR